MKKKNLGRIAAASLAAMTAVSAMSVTASALTVENNIAKGDIYKVIVTTEINGVTVKSDPIYYTSSDAANAVIGGTVTTVNAESVFAGKTIWVGSDKKISTTQITGDNVSKWTVAGSGSTSNPNYNYGYSYASSLIYKGSNGKWYPNYQSLIAAGTTYVTSQSPNGLTYYEAKYSSADGRVYFDRDSGSYSYVPTGDWVEILSYDDDNYYNRPSNYDTYDVYKVGNTYYPTLSSALDAAANNYSLITKIYDYSRPQTNYFSKTTGRYYATYADALRASGNSSSNVYTFSYYNNDYYYGNYYYNDPYYYYWLDRQNNKNDDTTSSKNDSTTASVGNRKGWTAVAKYLGSLKNGSSVSVSMNNETSIPSSVTSALKGKNVTAKFVLSNGVVFTINGKDISTTSSIDIDTAYNTNMVPTKLVKAAYKKNKAVSNAQITISSGSFGAEADVTVKFATKRAGCTAKLYRYNPSKETLSLVDTAKVQSNGKCTFGDVDKGGNFVIILC